eukprot:8774398-Pyramimonas_sp.AAC.1
MGEAGKHNPPAVQVPDAPRVRIGASVHAKGDPPHGHVRGDARPCIPAEVLHDTQAGAALLQVVVLPKKPSQHRGSHVAHGREDRSSERLNACTKEPKLVTYT